MKEHIDDTPRMEVRCLFSIVSSEERAVACAEVSDVRGDAGAIVAQCARAAASIAQQSRGWKAGVGSDVVAAGGTAGGAGAGFVVVGVDAGSRAAPFA